MEVDMAEIGGDGAPEIERTSSAASGTRSD
jgi:hypothetical protein